MSEYERNKAVMKLHKFKAERVWLAPMSGSTDAAFRRQAVRFGCPAVVSEMVAGETLVSARPDTVRRTCRHEGRGRWIVQLAAREPEYMRRGAELLAHAGVDQIDINMGCPSRQVTGGSSGSALMREPDLARAIMDAALEGSGGLPVSLKMRLGWDERQLNAPQLAEYATKAGIVMLTVHGRTRCQFYKGHADWKQIRNTVERSGAPVIANGDITGTETAKTALKQSGAYGVMIGRAALGQPWLPAKVAANLEGRSYIVPGISEQLDSLLNQIEDSQSLYGKALGLRVVRKHIAAAIDKLDHDWSPVMRRSLRSTACQIENSSALVPYLTSVFLEQDGVAA